MKLKPITQQEDKTNEIYASADCQTREYYAYPHYIKLDKK